MKRPMQLCLLAALTALLGAAATPALAETTDLTDLSLEALMDIQVTSVSKKEESLRETAAAVFVVTAEDIRRSGATTIPELLRLVPGVNVARIDANRWAISVRGFNGLFANSLLVLMDGRTLYTPLFSGVFWDIQDTALEDIDRIEVIRGPGAAVWGANAVNGVINIITKHSKDTQGGLLNLGGGTEDRSFVTARVGEDFGNGVTGRAYGKYRGHDSTELVTTNDEAFDSWEHFQGGFRFDWDGESNDLTLQGDIYGSREQFAPTAITTTPPFSELRETFTHTRGGNALARWTHTFSEDSALTTQLYFDRADRKDRSDGLVDARFDTIDADMQLRQALSATNVLQAGLGYRAISDELAAGYLVRFDTDSRDVRVLSGFLQDEQTFLNDTLHLTLGTKFEDNSYTGVELQPSVRVAWLPSRTQTVWAAISRAVHTPSRADRDVHLDISTVPLPTGGTLTSTLVGNDELDAQDLVAYELGYRYQVSSTFALTTALFFNASDHLYTLEPGAPSPLSATELVLPISFANRAQSESFGGEVLADWHVSDRWKLRGWYSFVEVNVWKDPGALGTVSDDEGSTARHQLSLRSLLDLTEDVTLDAHLRHIGSVPSFSIDHYTELDVRLAWQVQENIELAVAGFNLLNSEHEEYISNFVTIPASAIERSFLGSVTVRF